MGGYTGPSVGFEGDATRVKLCCCTVTQTVIATVTVTPEGGDWMLELGDHTSCEACPPPEALDVFGNPKAVQTTSSDDGGGGVTIHSFFSQMKKICGRCKCHIGVGNPGACVKYETTFGSWTGSTSTGTMPKWAVEMTCNTPCPELTGTQVGSKWLRVMNALGTTTGPNCRNVGKCCDPAKGSFGVSV